MGPLNIGIYVVVVGGALRNRPEAVYVVALTLVLWAGASVLTWWRRTFLVRGDELILTHGVITTRRLILPIDRIQSVAIEQGLLHRMLRIVQARIDSAGTAEEEFVINALDRPTAVALRERVAALRARSRKD